MAQLVDWTWDAVGNIAAWWILLALIAIVLAFWFGWFVPKKKAFGKATTFDARIGGFRPADAANILGEFTPETLKTYEFQARVVDMLFPIFYALMAAVWIRLCAPERTQLRWLILLPFTAAIFDWLENIAVVSVIRRFRKNPADLGSMPVLLMIAQRIKWLHFGAIFVVVALVTVGCVRAFLQR